MTTGMQMTVNALTGCRVTPKAIIISAIYNKEKPKQKGKPDEAGGVNAQEEHTSRCPEEPLPEFGKALAKLAKPAMTFLELPAEWEKGVTVTGFAIKTTKAGTRSVSIEFDKHLELVGGAVKMKTPFIRIDKPQPGEQDKPQATTSAKTLIGKAITCAVDYANGQRSQQLLDLKDDENEDGESGEEGPDLFNTGEGEPDE